MTDEGGGGWLATVPDLPGCMSDGETREEAAHNVQYAIASKRHVSMTEALP